MWRFEITTSFFLEGRVQFLAFVGFAFLSKRNHYQPLSPREVCSLWRSVSGSPHKSGSATNGISSTIIH
jgi:hypothetical protein